MKRPSRSPGSSFGAVAGALIVAAFFLPWVRACNVELTGYDIASNQTGTIQDAWVYWAVPVAGAVLIALFLLFKTRGFGGRLGLGFTRLIVGLVGFLPVLNLWYNVQQREGLVEILYGGWVLAVGFAGAFLSFVVDLVSSD